MKRGAERQLTKEQMEEGHVEPESESDTGFKKASDEILKTRVIRGLPNRTKPSNVQSNSTNGTTASSLFPSSTASPSTFTFPASSSASPAAHSSDSANIFSSSPFAKFDAQTSPFGQSTTAPPTTSFAFPSSSDKPISSTPSSTVKAFTSVLNNSGSTLFGSSAPSNPLSSSSNQPAAADEDDSVLLKYYINLRGLNHSLLNAISKGIEDDPFTDMTGILESYKSTYLKILKEKDDASATSKPESSNSSPSKSSSFSFTPVAASSFGKPPTQGAQSSFSTSGVSSTPSTSFFSSPSAGVQPFGFSSPAGSKTLNSSNETPIQSVFGVPAQKPSPFNPPEQTSSTTTTSAFGSTSSPFKFGGPTTNPSSPSTTTSAFGLTSSPFKFGVPTTNPSPPSIFGSSKPTSAFKWGATADQPATFDASDKSSTDTSTPAPAAGNADHFQFGSGSSGIDQSQSKTPVSADEKTADDATDGAGSEQATPTTEGGGESNEGVSNLLAVHNPHDDEGEGEENEISVHAIKVKAYRMKKADAKGGPGWADLGFGILRLKKDKDTGARRMLLRNSTNGKILINFRIYSGLKPSLAKKALTFVGHDNGVSQTYCIRLSGEDQAQQLKEALDQEINLVTAKDAE